ncbi:MAG: acyltransferase [Crocinitomicaceae bacterium]|nr:acyltransferase [Crocinitomicaceae bacterium]
MANRSSQKIPHIYFENLDALRFLAAFSVFLFHLFADLKPIVPALETNNVTNKFMVIFDKGSLGVNFFFVLSGFLITYLLLHERKYKGHFSLKKFLIRRTLRIWPLYFIVVLIGFVIFPLLIHGYETSHDPWMYVAFLANFDEIKNGMADPYNFLTMPWSVAVEEQFYLFWGVTLFFFLTVKGFRLWHLLLFLYIASFIFRWQHREDEYVLYYHTLAVCQDILAGAFIGWSLFEGRVWLEKLKKLNLLWVIVIYLIGFTLCVAKNKIFAGDLVVLERFVLGAFFAFIILDQVRGEHSFFKFGRVKAFNYLGRISYGLYMYHLIVMYFIYDWIRYSDMNGTVLIVMYFLISFAGIVSVASLSYYAIERPFLRMKPK